MTFKTLTLLTTIITLILGMSYGYKEIMALDQKLNTLTDRYTENSKDINNIKISLNKLIDDTEKLTEDTNTLAGRLDQDNINIKEDIKKLGDETEKNIKRLKERHQGCVVAVDTEGGRTFEIQPC